LFFRNWIAKFETRHGDLC